MIIKRAYLIVVDSLGIGAMPDCERYGDSKTVNTLKSLYKTGKLNVPNLQSLGLFNIEGVDYGEKAEQPLGSFARLTEASVGKDTTTGHWEIAGHITKEPLPTYPDGFPPEVVEKLEAAFGSKILCNKPYSGTQVIMDYGKEHIETKSPIVYTSADSVLQIAAHEEVIPLDELYSMCQKSRSIMQGKHGVGRIIARPFVGEYPNYIRTTNRHDYSLEVPVDTIMDMLKVVGQSVAAVGKIQDIFAGRGTTAYIPISSTADAMEKVLKRATEKHRGLCFINLVDFDMKYGHRRDADGYAIALNEFDEYLGKLMETIEDEDTILITADHGCDPTATGTDHTREYVPFVIYGKGIKAGVDLGTRESMADIAATIADMLRSPMRTEGKSFWRQIKGY